jgi:hypothetical protein
MLPLLTFVRHATVPTRRGAPRFGILGFCALSERYRTDDSAMESKEEHLTREAKGRSRRSVFAGAGRQRHLQSALCDRSSSTSSKEATSPPFFDMETTDGIDRVFDRIRVVDGELKEIHSFYYPRPLHTNG